jgi:hypothetical protein
MTTNVRRNLTRRDVAAALDAMRVACKPTDREFVQRRFASANSEYTAATEAVIRQDHRAAERVDAALAELNAARAALSALDREASNA